jgi:hypothetical protein
MLKNKLDCRNIKKLKNDSFCIIFIIKNDNYEKMAFFIIKTIHKKCHFSSRKYAELSFSVKKIIQKNVVFFNFLHLILIFNLL